MASRKQWSIVRHVLSCFENQTNFGQLRSKYPYFSSFIYRHNWAIHPSPITQSLPNGCGIWSPNARGPGRESCTFPDSAFISFWLFGGKQMLIQECKLHPLSVLWLSLDYQNLLRIIKDWIRVIHVLCSSNKNHEQMCPITLTGSDQSQNVPTDCKWTIFETWLPKTFSVWQEQIWWRCYDICKTGYPL